MRSRKTQHRGLQAFLLSREIFLSCHWKTCGWTVPQSWLRPRYPSREHDPQAGLGGRGHPDVLGFRHPSWDIPLAWLQDEEPLSQDAQSGGVLPDGSGTYQTWVTLRAPQGEEQRFTCSGEHSGNHSEHPVPSGKALVVRVAGQPFWVSLLLLLLSSSFSVSFGARRRHHRLRRTQVRNLGSGLGALPVTQGPSHLPLHRQVWG